MNQMWDFKNFNMVHELDLSGEFIYDGIAALNEMKNVLTAERLLSWLLRRIQSFPLLLGILQII